MTDTDIQQIEDIIRSRFRKSFDASHITAALAVVGLIGSVAYSFAVTEQRVQSATTTVQEMRVKAEQVPELRWEIQQIKRDIDRMDTRNRSMETKVNEIHEAIIRMGVKVGK